MRPRVEKKHLLLFNCGDYKIMQSCYGAAGAAAGKPASVESYYSVQEPRRVYRWYSNSQSYRETVSPSWMPISSSRAYSPDSRSFRSNQFLDS